MIRCPTTNRLINSGMWADKMSYESGTFANNTTVCPYCGKEHVWSKENTLLGDDPDTLDKN